MPKFTCAVMKKINKSLSVRFFGCAKTTLQAIAYPNSPRRPVQAVILSAPVLPPAAADAGLQAGLPGRIVV